jgi:hypothetical protein
MRDFGIVTLLSVIATAAAPSVPTSTIAVHATAEPIRALAGCHAQMRQRQTAPRAQGLSQCI